MQPAERESGLLGIVKPFESWTPQLGDAVFVAPGAVVIGRVTLADRVSIWYNAIVRGDLQPIVIGAGTNVQDGSILHTGHRDGEALTIGCDVTIGHMACVHGCTVEDECLIGIGATVLNGARVESGAYVAAGALVPPGMVVPAGMLVAGVPAKVIREVRPAERDDLLPSSERYQENARRHARALRA